jgi:hypothetical protein
MATMTISSKLIHCRGCGEFLWVQGYDHDRNLAFVKIGSMKVNSISGSCWVCGEEYHWRAEEVRLERLVKGNADS